MNNFLQRLKQRKLVQWALAYVAAAFALLQGIDIVAQQFGWPEGVRRGLTLALVVGFLVTLVLAWYHGERGAQKVTTTELLILALLLALGGGFLWRFAGASEKRSVSTLTVPVPPGAVAATPLPVPQKSIAVLPFENLSEEKANAYFAEGVQDEILTRLAKVADLKVISRTSTQKYKSAPDNLREIAKQLGVMHVVEGSVQKSADQVRVNVQLINAVTDAHLWADTYDRKLTDIFTVETEIAQTIADMLQAKLSGSEKAMMAKRPTESPEAHELYLRGRFFWNKRTAADLRKSIEYFDQAIAKDPNYAPAYAGESQAWSVLSAYNAASPADSYPKAEEFAKKALAIDDTSAEALVGLASVKARYQFDVLAALKDYERAIELNPNDSTAHHWIGGDCFAAMGQHEREIEELKRALALDPFSLIINSNLGVAYVRAGRIDEAVTQFRKTIETDDGFYPAHREYALALELKGRMPEAISEDEKATTLTDDPIPLGALARIYGIAGRKAEAQKIFDQLRRLREQRYTAAYSLALAALGVGDKAEALRWLEEGYRERDGDSLTVIRVDPLLASLRDDPRFAALAEKILPAAQFAREATTSK